MSGHVSRFSAGEYQADEPAGLNTAPNKAHNGIFL